MNKAQKSVMMAAKSELEAAGLNANLTWTENLLTARVYGSLKDRHDAIEVMQKVEDTLGWECCAVEATDNVW